jgi:hypothetical protein
MLLSLLWRLLLVVGCLISVGGILPAYAQSQGSPQAMLQKAVAALQRAEQLVADDPEGALAAAKESRQTFSELQKATVAKLSERVLTEGQIEKEKVQLQLAEDLYKKGELFQKAAQEKIARSKELRTQGDEAAALNLEGVAQIEGRLALQNYVRSMIYGLKNQQLVFEDLLQKAK